MKWQAFSLRILYLPHLITKNSSNILWKCRNIVLLYVQNAVFFIKKNPAKTICIFVP